VSSSGRAKHRMMADPLDNTDDGRAERDWARLHICVETLTAFLF